VRLLAFVMAGAGVLFGATEVGVAAAAGTLGSSAAAGPLLGLWGAGGFAGGLVIARAGGGARSGLGLAALLAALAGAHLALMAAAGSLVALAIVLVLAGTLIAPTCASAYAMVEDAAPRGTTTEAFAWMTTAVAIGTSAGAASAGLVADDAGPGATFLLAGVAAGAVAALAAVASLRNQHQERIIMNLESTTTTAAAVRTR
jgi:predicted MFS family arabinose efflux permease